MQGFRIGLAALMVLHGIAHLRGFAGRCRWER
jgi:hypothetical protein